jgi:hypothetical protein
MNFLSDIPTGIFILISALIAALVALMVPRINRSREASNNFRHTVLNELKEIYPTCSKEPDSLNEYLRSRYPALQAAINHYRHFLPLYKQPALDKAWNKYRGYDNDGSNLEEHYFQYRDYTLDDIPNNGKENLKNNVAALLALSKKT